MKKTLFSLFVALIFIVSCSENEPLNSYEKVHFDRDSDTKLVGKLSGPEYPILHFDSLNYSFSREDVNKMADKSLFYPEIDIFHPTNGESFNMYGFFPEQCIIMWYKVSNLFSDAHVKAYVDGIVYRDFWIPDEASWMEDQFCALPWELGVGDHIFKIWAKHKIFGISFKKTKSITFNIYYESPAPLSVYISGPTHLDPDENGTFTANPSGGSGTYTNYKWWYRNDESIPEPFGTNDVTPLAPPPGVWIYLSTYEGEQTIIFGPSFDFSLKCEVTDSDGNTASDIHSVYVY